MLSSEDKKKIAQILDSKISNISCPMCQNKQFIIVDGYFINNMQTDFSSITIGGNPSIPTIAIICNQCGFTSQHSLGVLGLLPNTDKKQNNE